jgi:hypothetical protein
MACSGTPLPLPHSPLYFAYQKFFKVPSYTIRPKPPPSSPTAYCFMFLLRIREILPRRYDPEDRHRHLHRPEDVKFHTNLDFIFWGYTEVQFMEPLNM